MKILLAALALILSVSANAQSWERLEGRHSGVTVPMAAAVQDSQKWAEIWRQHDATAPIPEVDFSKESVVVVFSGRHQTAGVTITVVVQKDPLDDNRLNVFYRETVTNKGFSAQVQCEPYTIVKVPKAAVIDVEKDGVVKIPEQNRAPAPKRDDRKMKALIDSLEAPNFN
jgi:hypothetical protein